MTREIAGFLKGKTKQNVVFLSFFAYCVAKKKICICICVGMHDGYLDPCQLQLLGWRFSS